MDYEEMSDNELNMIVADLRGGYAGNVHGSESMVKVSDPTSGGLCYMEVDYCNNPSDAWPIINTMIADGCIVQLLEHGVIVTLQGGGRLQSAGAKTLRAAIIVFLKMKGTV